MRRVLVLAAAALVLIYVALFVAPPRAVVRTLASAFPTALAAERHPDAALPRAMHRALDLYVDAALSAYVADGIDTDGADTAVLGRIIDAVRGQVLTQVQVRHEPKPWSALTTGFGYCDQINAAVASIAAHHFPHAQIYALFDPERNTSPHTIGRVWSEERDEWLYFDAFYDVPIVFARRADGSLRFVDTGGRTLPSRTPPPLELYRLTGWVMNEYGASAGGQIALKVANRLGWGGIEARPYRPGGPRGERPTPVATTADSPERSTPASSIGQGDGSAARPAARTVAPVRDAPTFERLARAYIRARIEHVLSGVPNRESYRAVATDATAVRDTRASELAVAARLFTSTQ